MACSITGGSAHRPASQTQSTDDHKAVVNDRLRPRSRAAPWWLSLSIRPGVKSVPPNFDSLEVYAFYVAD